MKAKDIEVIIKGMKSIYYRKGKTKYFIGDKVAGKFEFGEKYGVVKFGEFDAYWPSGAHEYAYAYGFYVETITELGNKQEYSINQIEALSKI